MMELDLDEKRSLSEALLSAFPSRGALDQVAYFYLGSNLEELVTGGPLPKVVQDLITWAEANGKTPDLISGARKVNSGNSKLQDFETRYNARRPGTPPVRPDPAQVLTQALRDQLVENLLKIPLSGSFDGRSSYLIGLPWAQTLNRSPTNVNLDLQMIVDQLNTLGKLESGAWPLLILIENAAASVKGLQIGKDLLALRDTLQQGYKEASGA
jgi:hypothetical protein